MDLLRQFSRYYQPLGGHFTAGTFRRDSSMKHRTHVLLMLDMPRAHHFRGPAQVYKCSMTWFAKIVPFCLSTGDDDQIFTLYLLFLGF